MRTELERLIIAVYRQYKSAANSVLLRHPDEETLCGYLEGRLPNEETESVKNHLLECGDCAEAAAAAMRMETERDLDVPDGLISEVKDSMSKGNCPVLEIFVGLKEKFIELLNTNADVLVEQEWVPASLLRSRNIKTFKDEIVVLKDYGEIRLEARIRNKGKERFGLTVAIKGRLSSRPVKDLRVSLLKDDTELESYITSSGRADFEDAGTGRYEIWISGIEERIISFLLDVTG